MKAITFFLCGDCFTIFAEDADPEGVPECPDCGDHSDMPLDGYEYEKGDLVTVKSRDELNENLPEDAHYMDYDELDPGFDPEMSDFCGVDTHITKVYNNDSRWIELACDKNEWTWSPFWLKPRTHKSLVGLQECLKDDLFDL